MELVNQLLGAYAAPDLGAPANYSLWLESGRADGRPDSLNMLYRGRCIAARSRSSADVVGALLRHLEAHVTEQDPTRVRAKLMTLLSPAGAVLVSAGLLQAMATHERPLARAGLRLVHGDLTSIDVQSGQVVIDPPRLKVDEDAKAKLESLGPPSRGASTATVEGRYPVAALVISNALGSLDPISRARTVALAAPLLLSDHADKTAAVRALARATEGTRLVAAGSLSADALANALPSLIGV
jgi:hypothetical protein